MSEGTEAFAGVGLGFQELSGHFVETDVSAGEPVGFRLDVSMRRSSPAAAE